MMNTGTDYTFGYYDGSTGVIVDLGDVQDVKITANKHDIKSAPYNAPPRYGYVPDGFTIDFTITRTGSALEDAAVVFEANFNHGKVIKPGFLNQTTTNPDGTVSRYQYTNFVFFLPDHGDISREKVVQQKGHGQASQKVRIA